MESNFQDSINRLSKLGLLKPRDIEILSKVDEACQELVSPEYEAYIERRFNQAGPKIISDYGLMGLPISEEFGGLGVNSLVHSLAMERFGQLGMGIVTLVDVHQFLGSLTVQQWGTKDQKARILPEAARGTSIFAYALTEPEAGSDPSLMSTTFGESDDGNSYILNGSKYLISNGSIARYLVVFAKSDFDGLVSSFVVDSRTEGFEVAMHLSEKIGLFTSDTALIEFHDMKIPKDCLLGIKGKGLSVAYSALLNGRIGIASGCLGVMEDCLNSCVERAKSRMQHGKIIGKHQLIQRHIARIAMNLESSKWPVYLAAMLKDELDRDPQDLMLRTRVDRQSATAKLLASTSAYDASDRAVQIFGGFGYSILSPVAKHLIDSRVARIYEGTDEIMELKIASSILGREYEAYK
ncbi:MAG TPA: acyl-CoA dehydrogenase family protein [Nitrososphaerales archaeon]|nr:acyl-CoA dehydrogenase family protein [Nitrososphaerales archaeon]